MSAGSLHLSSEPPPSPGNADFALYISFIRGEGNPSRVFLAADAMIRTFQKLDRALVRSIDAHIEPVLVLEEVETGSLKIWLRDRLEAIDDQAIKTLDWRTIVGKYLVDAKYIYIEWANSDGPNTNLVDLGRRLAKLASDTDVRHLPDYAPPSVKELTEATKDMQEAKGYLITGDVMSYQPAISAGEIRDPIKFDLSISWSPEKLLELARGETTRYENMAMNLIVKRPDYLGNAMWEFRHGRTPVNAKIIDIGWLHRFQTRSVDVRPGDALKCVVTLERSYSLDNELLDEAYTITEVKGVLPNMLRQSEMFSPPDGLPDPGF